MADEESGKRQPWPVRRFVKTLFFFNKPRLPLPPPLRRLVRRRSGAALAERATDTSCPEALKGVVLVTGATGGVGRRVVERLLKSGARVRALVRNRSKAQAMLGPLASGDRQSRLEVVTADITNPSSLTPGALEGVTAVVSCTAATVRPKEGDSEDRAKYFQGIKFYEPEVADVPEEIEAKGIKNLISALNDYSDVTGKTLFGCGPTQRQRWERWGALDDVVMGGVSESGLRMEGGVAVFDGAVSTANSGGFVSARSKNEDPPMDLSGFDGLRLRVKGDGKRYKFIVYDAAGWDRMSWAKSFDTTAGEWTTVTILWSDLVPNFRTKLMTDPAPLKTSSIYSFQVMLSKFEYGKDLNPNFSPGAFRLEIDYIKAVSVPGTKGMLPRLVHVSSSGVTRPGRPGLIVENEPPAVRMNDMLGGLLTHKLSGEDAVRDSGIPAAIVRPCALTEEPSGAPLLIDQGDTFKGKVSRDDIADLCVGALQTPLPQLSTDKAGSSCVTFEVKSNLAFSDVWQGGADGRPVQRPDYLALLRQLSTAKTGKEWMSLK